MTVSKREQYEALIATGMSQLQIATLYGVTRQAVSAALIKYPRIPWKLRTYALYRDDKKCSLCGEETWRCAVIDQSKPPTVDNVGLMCRKCLRKFRGAQRTKRAPPKLCHLAGCTNETEKGRRYCSAEHKAIAAQQLHEKRVEKWKNQVSRTCTRCLIEKPVSEFYVSKRYVTGMRRYSRCKKCHWDLMKLRVQKIKADPTSEAYKHYKDVQRRASIRHQAARRADPVLYARILEQSHVNYRKRMARLRAAREKKRKEMIENPRFKELMAQLKARI